MGKDKKSNDGHAKSRSSRAPRDRPASQAHGQGHPNYTTGQGHQSYTDGGLGGNPQRDPFWYIPNQPSTTPRCGPEDQDFDLSHGGGASGNAPHASLSSIASGSTDSQRLYCPSATTQSQVTLDAAPSDVAGDMAHMTLDQGHPGQQHHWGGTSMTPLASTGPSAGYAAGSQAYLSSSYQDDPSVVPSASMQGHTSSTSPIQEHFYQGHGGGQYHPDDIDEGADSQQQGGSGEWPTAEAAEYGQGDYEDPQHHVGNMDDQWISDQGGEVPGAGAAAYDPGWEPGTDQAEVDPQAASAERRLDRRAFYGGGASYGHEAIYGGVASYGGEAGSGDEASYGGERHLNRGATYGSGTSYGREASYGSERHLNRAATYGGEASYDVGARPSTPGQSLPGPSLRVHVDMKKKITKVIRHRHPGAEYAVLCKSVADEIRLDDVEKLTEFPVFTESESGNTANATKRTRLRCAEEYERNKLYGWDNVEFYIVPDLEKNFGYKMLLPLEYYWGVDESRSSGKKKSGESRPSGKKKTR